MSNYKDLIKMKKFSTRYFYTYLVMIFVSSTTTTHAINAEWDTRNLNTASKAEYLTELEKDLIVEINMLRSDPSRYAKEHIAPLAKYYEKRILHYPGDQPLITREGVSALNECVRELRRQKPLPLVYPAYGLSLAARDHVKDQSKSGETGHTGGDKSGMRDRIERYGKWETRIAENIAYGAKTARQIVVYLLIDDGVPGRGHRKNFLTPEFKTIGVSIGLHPQYKIMSVMDFAGGYNTSLEY